MKSPRSLLERLKGWRPGAEITPLVQEVWKLEKLEPMGKLNLALSELYVLVWVGAEAADFVLSLGRREALLPRWATGGGLLAIPLLFLGCLVFVWYTHVRQHERPPDIDDIDFDLY
jgi:hypothetical protein